MTQVDGIGPLLPAARGPARALGRATGFTVPSGRAESASGTAGAEAAEVAEVAFGGMLALQEVESEPVRDREARRRGQQMLDELLRLQRALLAGPPDPDALYRLAELATDIPDAADPALRRVVAEVTLRARVELARHETITTG